MKSPSLIEASTGASQAVTPPRGTTLYSTAVPGLPKFIDQDVAPIARGVATSAREIKNALSPQTASPDAQLTADTVREAKARVANAGADRPVEVRSGRENLCDGERHREHREYFALRAHGPLCPRATGLQRLL